MNDSELVTATLLEEALGEHSAFRKVDKRLYVVKQGSAYVMINLIPWGDNKCMVRCVAQVVRGVELTPTLSSYLLRLNAIVGFGAFAYEPQEKLVLFIHSILGGPTLDQEEIFATLSDVALIADKYDDKISNAHGGQTMADVVAEEALRNVLELSPDQFEEL